MRDKPRWEIIHGDSLTVLESFPPGTFDAVITDPPYASGGRTQAEKSKATVKKYSSMGGNAPPDFDGDAKDQRSWTRSSEERRVGKEGRERGAPYKEKKKKKEKKIERSRKDRNRHKKKKGDRSNKSRTHGAIQKETRIRTNVRGKERTNEE